jgi:hypothetical protein
MNVKKELVRELKERSITLYADQWVKVSNTAKSEGRSVPSVIRQAVDMFFMARALNGKNNRRTA